MLNPSIIKCIKSKLKNRKLFPLGLFLFCVVFTIFLGFFPIQLRVTEAAQIQQAVPESHDVLRLEFAKAFDPGSATTLNNYQIRSETDSDYSIPQTPISSGYSYRGVGFSGQNSNSVIVKHYVYLHLPKKFKPSHTYTLHGSNIIDNFSLPIIFPSEEVPFTFDESEVSPNVKINQVGYFPVSEKVGILGGWLGTLAKPILT